MVLVELAGEEAVDDRGHHVELGVELVDGHQVEGDAEVDGFHQVELEPEVDGVHQGDDEDDECVDGVQDHGFGEVDDHVQGRSDDGKSGFLSSFSLGNGIAKQIIF